MDKRYKGLTHSEKSNLTKFLKRKIPYKIAIKLVKKEILTIDEGKTLPSYSKKKVSFKCKYCNKKSIATIRNISKRSNGLAWEPICNKCILKRACNTPDHIKNNSNAQKIAQNKPEQKEKQRIAQKLAHEKDPTLTKRKADAGLKYANSKEALKRRGERFKERYKNDKEFRRKLKPRGFVSGEINNIQFDSSYELRYLLYCIENNFDIIREPFEIPYEDRIYLPDFLINGINIIEIKGYKPKDDEVTKKELGAIEFCKGKKLTYEILYKKDLIKIGAWKINWEIFNKQNIHFVKNPATLKWLKKYEQNITKEVSLTWKF